MNYYIAKLDDDMHDSIETPYNYQGQTYEFAVEYGSNPGGFDEFVLKDGIGRSVPVAVQYIPELVRVLNNVYTNSKIMEESRALEADIENPRFIIIP